MQANRARNRVVPFPCTCIYYARELKLNCNEGNLRLMVVCDGVNSLCTEYTLVHREKTRFEAGPYKPWRPYRPTKDLLNKRAKVMILGVICILYVRMSAP